MRRRERVSLSFASWPILDRQLWEAAHVRDDFLEADGAAAGWRDKTRRQVIKGYGLWLFHLAAGVRITPHQFRHIAAKLHLDRHPGQYEVVRRLLDHKSVSTTYNHYAGAETKAAVAHYQETILGLQRSEPGPDVPCTARSNRRDGTHRRSSGRNGARPRKAAER